MLLSLADHYSFLSNILILIYEALLVTNSYKFDSTQTIRPYHLICINLHRVEFPINLVKLYILALLHRSFFYFSLDLSTLIH